MAVETYGNPNPIREDLSDLIHNISPTETPTLTASGASTATQTNHEWQEDTLFAPADNAQVEASVAGTDVSFTDQDTTRLGNYTQISSKAVEVSGTAEVVDKAGMDSQLAYQSALRARELKTDVDFGITGTNSPKVSVAIGTARRSASLVNWLPNFKGGGTGGAPAAPSFDGSDSWTYGTNSETLDQTYLDEPIQAAWADGGKPTLIVTGPTLKTKISGFDGLNNATSASVTRSDRAGRTIYATADVYVSNFGTLYVVPSRHIEVDAGNNNADRHVFMLDPEYLKVAYLRPWQQFDLAKIGDTVRRQLLVEWTLEVCNRNAHAVAVNVRA